ncbi:MAG: hypothetical protein B6D34_03820 [Candidatus Brocadia sp. UTAMX1]|jgi:hypothetical protein|nr:MAG: hypothetical protein B6D34_03820 [Candidatus Brocadia sp. UTAMX1]
MRNCLCTLPFYKPGDIAVNLKFLPICLEVCRARDMHDKNLLNHLCIDRFAFLSNIICFETPRRDGFETCLYNKKMEKIMPSLLQSQFPQV